MKTNKVQITIILLLAVSLLICSVYLLKYQSHNDFHRSRMIQYQFLNYIRNTTDDNLLKLQEAYPVTKQENSYYLLSSENVKSTEFIKSKNVQLLDFYGYEFKANDKGIITNAHLHKP